MQKVALAQIDIIPGQPFVNTKKILNMITAAKANNAELIVFPEFAVPGKMLGTSIMQPSFWEDCAICAAEITAAAFGIIVIFGNISNGKSAIFMAKNKQLQELAKNTAGVVQTDNIAVLPDSSPYYQGKTKAQYSFLSGMAKKQNMPLIYVSCTGVQNNGKTIYAFDGSSAVYNASGECTAKLPPFEESLRIIDINDTSYTESDASSDKTPVAEIFAALQYGTKHFLASIGVKRIVIGISGGIDSAVSAALYASILPPENIFLVNMPSRFNSATTKGLAKQLADNLGCNYAVFPIEESVNITVSQLESISFSRQNLTSNLTMSQLTRENIQARDRSSRILAAISACIGGCFTCNANKAETTIGYSTMYGDGSGFFSALADLWKFQIYELANYMNEYIYKRKVIPAETINIVPSAELSADQNIDKGQGDPLVYPYHDFLFRAFTEHKDRPVPADFLEWYINGTLEQKIGCQNNIVKELFPDTKSFTDDLERWWKLYTGMATAKRLQAPPFLVLTRCPFENESQNGSYFTKKYLNLKETVLS